MSPAIVRKPVLAAICAASLGIMIAAGPGAAVACDVTSATDTSCGPASVNPANPLSPLNPSNPLSVLSPSNPANLSSPLNPANQRANNPAYAGYGEPDLGAMLSALLGGGPAVAPAAAAYPAYPVVRHHHHYRRRHVE